MTDPGTPQRYADDMGYLTCSTCGAVFIPAPGFLNNGHQCHEDGLQKQFEDTDY